ncbi:hypothetical protein F5B20DRAFT_586786 [Whalleya microplaca]|nr:hypothetical protein F5B20DRAFT_586786 [Whalleya microplaca]
MSIIVQTWTLVRKNLLIVARRHWISAIMQAIIIPVVFTYITTIFRDFFLPPSQFGFGETRPIKNLTRDAFPASSRNRVAFVHNDLLGGPIEDVINGLATSLRDVGADVRILSSEVDLSSVCRSSLIGASNCFAAATFSSSPSEGPDRIWNYTARVDASLGRQIYIGSGDNDPQIYTLPFIHAVDREIARVTNAPFPEEMLEYPYTDITGEERDDDVQVFYMNAMVNDVALVLFIGVCVITFHLPGFIAAERELGMSQLIDSMVPNRHPWQTQIARMIAAHLAFDIIYLPGLIAITVIFHELTFYRTPYGILFAYHLLVMLALAGWACFGGSFFRKSQLSGITVLIVSLVLAVVAQLVPMSTTPVIVLSFLFPSMNYTFFMINLSSWERALTGIDLTAISPDENRPFDVAGYMFFIGLVVQIIAYPILATMSEWVLYGTSDTHRKLSLSTADNGPAIILSNFSKTYLPNWWHRWAVVPVFGKRKDPVRAVDDLSLAASRGEMVILLGANGSGKSTTLNCVSGVDAPSSGSIEIDGSGGLGLCPQKNILWDELTVEEHVFYFNRLKSRSGHDSADQTRKLIRACDLSGKFGKKSKTLSGGQKRKLQLAMAFTGGSQVVCVDEVSSGLDPLSRRKIWEILLAERGNRTFLLTTHALDEAEALADHIIVLSKGSLRVHGSVVELKHKYGGGYQVRVAQDAKLGDSFKHVPQTTSRFETIFHLADSTEASRIADQLDTLHIHDYQILGPTIEDVFLNLVDESKEELGTVTPETPSAEKHIRESSQETLPSSGIISTAKPGDSQLQLSRGKGASFPQQTWILFQKRLRIFSRNFLPYLFILVIPILTAGLVTLFLTDWSGITCDVGQSTSSPGLVSLPGYNAYRQVNLVAGPEDEIPRTLLTSVYGGLGGRIDEVQSYSAFMRYVRNRYRSLAPGGLYMHENDSGSPVLAYIANGMENSAFAKNIFDSLLMDTDISAQFSNFFIPLPSSAGDSIQLILYFGFAMCAYPAFFALYPTFERLQKVKALQYSNGIRPEPLWLAHLLFDIFFVLVISIAVIGLFVGLSNVWYGPGFVFAVFALYGIAAILLAYVTSLFAKSQLMAFAFVAGWQAFVFLIYFIIYMLLITFNNPESLFHNLNIVQYTLGLVSPSASLLRTLLLTLNQSQLLCREQSYVSYAGDMTVFGAPILYLTLQCVVLYTFLILYDSGWSARSLLPLFRLLRPSHDQHPSSSKTPDEESSPPSTPPNPAIAAEIARTTAATDGLRVLHVSKRYGREPAVDDLTFGVPHGSVFALLGPNGAGKSTTIGLVRGDVRLPSSTSHGGGGGGDVFVETHSVRAHRAAARACLGVCPQFDAVDALTVREQLAFYARACGVASVAATVSRVIAARKLSLGIALVGDPSVLLLDEPSSGMDAVARRAMWRVLAGVKAGRSLVITTHSMEEAAALADRSGIMATRLLAVGTTEQLCQTYGDAYYVHLVHRAGAGITRGEVGRIERWFGENIPAAVMDGVALHGQLKFVVPKQQSRGGGSSPTSSEEGGEISMASMLRLIERNKEALKIEYYSITQTTLEDVFLNVMKSANGTE